MKNKYLLPPDSIVVELDEVQEQVNGIYLGAESQEAPSTGKIVLAGSKNDPHVGRTGKFRLDFGEDIEIGGKTYKYFRAFDAAVYYIELE